MKKIILASASPRRKQILKQAGVIFTVVESTFKELPSKAMLPDQLVISNAEGKAKEIASRTENAVVIGADSIVYINKTILEKPKNENDAKTMLKMLSGTNHQVFTGYCLVDSDSGKTISNFVSGTVYFKSLTDAEIDSYIATGEPMDKAGAYAIQGIGGLFVKKVEGDFLGIVGLPLFSINQELQQFGINFLISPI